MLTFRKILLQDKLFIILFIFVIIISIIRISIPKQSNYGPNSTKIIGIIIECHHINDQYKMTIKGKEKVIVNYYSKDDIKLNLGDKIKVVGKFIKPESNKTKYLFNYKKYLERKNIFYMVKATSIKKINSSKNPYYLMKNIIISRIENDPYLNTFLIGDKTFINDNVIRSYQENGISHLLALSGMHISLLVSLISKFLKNFNLSEEDIFKYTSIILFAYLLLVGFSPSILRGVLFYFLFSLNRIYYFYIKKINLFLLIISISLLINPNFIFDIGFLYSYLISLSLILMSKELESNNYFISLLKVSLLSFFVSIPITLFNFYQLNILSIIYNLIFVPFVSIIIFPFTLFTFIFKPLSPIYSLLIIVLEKLSLFFCKFRFGKLIFKRLPLIVYILYFLIILLFLFRKKNEYIYLILILLFIHLLIPYYDQSKYIEMIDVGQGDSILLHSNNKNILIDTGGKLSNGGEIFYNTIYPLLKNSGIKKIDVLVISHGDFDHMGEAINLVNNFKVEKVIFNCGPYNDLEKELIKVLDKKKIKYYSCIKELNIDKNKLYFLQTKEYDNENDNSNVIYTELNGYKFMFMGDASNTTEREILNEYNLTDIDILKVGHHGSKTSSGKEFINEINPKYSIISVGKNNRYGHPNKQVLENLDNSKIYRTDQDGSIMFKIKNNKLQIETCSP